MALKREVRKARGRKDLEAEDETLSITNVECEEQWYFYVEIAST